MEVRFLTAGDRAVSVEFGKTICLETNAKVRMLDENLKEDPIEGMIETVPTYCALIIHYRPEVIRYGKLVKELEKRLGNMHAVDNSNKKKVVKEVPVYYGGETGPDLEYCAELEHTTVEEIIRKHSEHEYYVYMLGFAPGHPYMARFDEPFGFKRRESPRVKIPDDLLCPLQFSTLECLIDSSHNKQLHHARRLHRLVIEHESFIGAQILYVNRPFALVF